MQTKVLTTYPHTNAIAVNSDSFVPIGFGLEVLLPSDAKNGDSWFIDITQYKTNKPLSHTQQNKETIITSEIELISEIQGNLVITPNSTKHVVNLPNRKPINQLDHKSHSIVSFFNHLFLVKGRTLIWSDLDNIWEWQPHPHNEADFRTLEWESNDATGLVRSGDKLYLHFPNAIYEVNYVGKPTVVSIQQRLHGIGAVAPRTIVVHNTIQFFIGTDNFYAYSTESGLSAIGQDVWKEVVLTLGDINKAWAYVDQVNNEICWVLGEYIWAFNFVEKHWCKYSSNGILAHATLPWAEEIDESATTIEPVKATTIENVFVTSSTVCRNHRFSDGLDQCLEMTVPYLESDDITYGDLHFVKQVDLLMIDARVQFPWTGFRVFVSGKDFVSHPNNWIDCGLWTQEHESKQLDFKRVSGKVLKFKFVLEDGLFWNGLLPNGGLSLNGERLDIANGEIIMDGSRSDFLGRQFTSLDGTTTLGELYDGPKLGFVEFNAWGERVDLPQSLVGPDK